MHHCRAPAGPTLVEATKDYADAARSCDSPPFSNQLWKRVEGTIFRSITSHPFLVGLVDGTLSESCFRYYIAQDSIYLRYVLKPAQPGIGHLPSRHKPMVQIASCLGLVVLASTAVPISTRCGCMSPSLGDPQPQTLFDECLAAVSSATCQRQPCVASPCTLPLPAWAPACTRRRLSARIATTLPCLCLAMLPPQCC